MRVTRGIPAAPGNPAALTIGNFDGVHLGHQAMLAELKRAAGRLGVPACVLTFEPHPREFFAPDKAPTRLTSLREKLELLAACGVDRVHICRFNYRFAQTTAEDFIEHIVARGLGARWVLVGDDFRFGARRAGSLVMLKQAAAASRLRSGGAGERAARRRAGIEHRAAPGPRGRRARARAAAPGSSVLDQRARGARRRAGPQARVPDRQRADEAQPAAADRHIRRRGCTGSRAVRCPERASLGVRPTVQAAGRAGAGSASPRFRRRPLPPARARRVPAQAPRRGEVRRSRHAHAADRARRREREGLFPPQGRRGAENGQV